MIYFQQLENNKNILHYTVTTGSKILLNISITNKFSVPMVIQPSVRQLDTNNTAEELVTCLISPAHNYLRTKENCQLVLSFDIPKTIQSTTIKKFLIHFSSDKNCLIELHFTIAEMEKGIFGQFYDRNLQLDLPIRMESVNLDEPNKKPPPPNLYMEAITKLLEGLENLTNSPTRNLVTEAILTLCEMGHHKIQVENSIDLVRKFKRSVLFKNGVLIIAGSQLLNWLSVSNSMSSNHNGSKGINTLGYRHLVYWENWFMKLTQIDLENENIIWKTQEKNTTSSFNSILKEIGGEPDRFFLFFILGLIHVSPKISNVIQEICSKIVLDEETNNSIPEKKPDNIINENGSLRR